MSSESSTNNAFCFFVPQAQVQDHIKNTVDTLVTTPPAKIDRRWFLLCLTQQGAYGVKDTLDAVVTALAKSKKTDDHSKIAARIQDIIASAPALNGYKVEARIHQVWAEQQAAYEALTPEELAAYNALTPEELAEHSF